MINIILTMKDTILKEFDISKDTLNDLKDKMTILLSDLIKSESIQIHQISGRLKERVSLENKIDRKQDKYSSLHDITDIVGIRIITYLESNVDQIADIITKEFEIDSNNSVDKRKLKSKQFGYRSLHFVVSCKNERIKLIEYKRFVNLKFEIQIRSILQHAWAEIEHDLGYKGITSIPDTSKRSFNRLAALLESADLEFDRLKKELDKYESEVEGLIKNDPENVSIDQTSLISFVKNNKTIIEAQKIISKNVGCQFIPNTDYKGMIELFKDFFHISNISMLHNIVEENHFLYLEFVNEFTKNLKYHELTEQIMIFYLQHFLAAKEENQELLNKYYQAASLGGYRDMIKAIQSAKKNIAKT